MNRYLAIYLNDHRAIEEALLHTSQRVLSSNSGTPWSDELRALNEAISADAAELDAVRQAADIEGGTVKRLAAQLGERVGRLKLNGHLLSYSPLSRVLEAEGMMASLELKRARWTTLEAMASSRPEWQPFDFADLERRAVEQVETVRSFHGWAVSELAKRQKRA